MNNKKGHLTLELEKDHHLNLARQLQNEGKTEQAAEHFAIAAELSLKADKVESKIIEHLCS